MALPSTTEQGNRVHRRGFFICYRHKDSEGEATHLYDRLQQKLGQNHVFIDYNFLKPGTHWSEEIESCIKSCYALIAVIGDHWQIAGENGQPRLFELEDPVRKEIAIAMNAGVKIVPILLAGAAMPEKAKLPDNLKALPDIQALTLDRYHFDPDVDKLLRRLKDIRRKRIREDRSELRKKSPWMLPTAIAFLMILAIGIWRLGIPNFTRVFSPLAKYRVTAQKHFSEGRYGDVIVVVNEWLIKDPQNGEAESLRFRATEILRKLRDFELAIRANDYVGAREALEQMEEIHKEDPNDGIHHTRLDEIFAPEFQDEFLGPLDPWVAPDTWSGGNGSLVVSGVGLGFLKNKHYRNFTATFNISFLNSKGAVWILRAERNLSHCYLFQLTGPRGNPSNSFAGFRLSNGKTELILGPVAVGADLGKRDDQFNIKINAVGEKIDHYIELVSEPTGEPRLLAQMIDPAFLEGTIGFGVRDNERFVVRALKIVPIRDSQTAGRKTQ
jgi:hypothetical protein